MTLISRFSQQLADDLGINKATKETIEANWTTGAPPFKLGRVFTDIKQSLKINRLIKSVKVSNLTFIDRSRIDPVTPQNVAKYIYPYLIGNSNDLDACNQISEYSVYIKPSLTADEVNEDEKVIVLGYYYFISQCLLNFYMIPNIVMQWLFFSIRTKQLDFGFLRILILYGTILKFVRRSKVSAALLLTSNSYFIEVFRYSLLATSAKVTEILHGIPSLELCDYHKSFKKLLVGDDRRTFIPPVPRMSNEIVGAVGGNVVEDHTYVNLTINRNRETNIESQLNSFKDFINITNQDKFYVVTINGGAANSVDYCNSIQFVAEKRIIDFITGWGIRMNINIVVIYSVHPFHTKSGHSKQIEDNLGKVFFTNNSFFTWLISDLVVSLYSSSLWDARFIGAFSFTPIRESYNLFTKEILSTIAHPKSDESIESALENTLGLLQGTSLECLYARMDERKAKISI